MAGGRRQLAALLLAGGALGVSALAWLRPAPDPAPCTCAEPAPAATDRSAIARLEARVAGLEAALSARQGSPLEAALLGALTPTPPADAAPRERPRPTRYVRFISPSPDVRVEQSERGSLAVFNRDPALTGQILQIQGVDEAGGETTLTVTVPPP